uniref:Recep_L_domain domain-containing protein n=1 Tax=Parastrongyloides trichosuri TaxID=131310 RepID=A0A0N4ZDN0_PARTI
MKLLGTVHRYTNFTVCTKNDTLWMYVSLNIPSLAIGTINICDRWAVDIINDILVARADVSELYADLFSKSLQKFDITALCLLHNKKPIYKSTLTGEMTLYINCYNTTMNQLDLSMSPNFTSPILSDTGISCNDLNDVIFCDEGYCGTFQKEIYVNLNNNISFEEDLMCPNDLINKVYFETKNRMYSTQYIDSLNVAPMVCSNKTSYSSQNFTNYPYYYWKVNCFNPSLYNGTYFETMPKLPYYETSTQTIYGTLNNEASNNRHNYELMISFLVLFFKFL